MQSHFDLTDEAFEQAFRTCSLPPRLFTHEAHLRLAWMHLKKAQPSTAIEIVRSQIIAFVEQLGARDKYHETLTIAAIQIVRHFINKAHSVSFEAFIEEFPQLMSDFRNLVQSHYSFDIFSSEEARATYLTPDIIPFDETDFDAHKTYGRD